MGGLSIKFETDGDEYGVYVPRGAVLLFLDFELARRRLLDLDEILALTLDLAFDFDLTAKLGQLVKAHDGTDDDKTNSSWKRCVQQLSWGMPRPTCSRWSWLWTVVVRDGYRTRRVTNQISRQRKAENSKRKGLVQKQEHSARRERGWERVEGAFEERGLRAFGYSLAPDAQPGNFRASNNFRSRDAPNGPPFFAA